ncbi:MAG TPA: exonuclease domain-containing protein, partial [Burkholderiales bacterium]|nr:exonuclease domain-containing protein [Burkholderiales bacterium]
PAACSDTRRRTAAIEAWLDTIERLFDNIEQSFFPSMHIQMPALSRLAFVDLETSGLSPRADRITEIGVITVDAGKVEEWTTLINPGRDVTERARARNEQFCGGNGVANEDLAAAPSFADIAAQLHARLAGRLFVAHNARFDFGFLHAAFARSGLEFAPPVLCTVMLSRKLYPDVAGHDLDTLMDRHGLQAEVRHRALPDARLLWQFWRIIQGEHSAENLAAAVEQLLAGPVLPAHLDPSLIDRLPEAPGVYVLHGGNAAVLHIGKAANLRRHLIAYFRLDRTSAKAAAVSHLVRNITWRETRGAIGAYLQRAALAEAAAPCHAARALVAWRLQPDAYPAAELVALENGTRNGGDLYGLFDSARKARNALLRLAKREHLCLGLLGLAHLPAAPCTACAVHDPAQCVRRTDRLKHLAKAAVALRSWRVEQWPYDGPIGVRERSDLHVLDDWRYLGTAQGEHEVHQVMQTRAQYFDQDTFNFLTRTLRRLPRRRILRLTPVRDANPFDPP